jgi:2-methylcitrate dehydratase PrpD
MTFASSGATAPPSHARTPGPTAAFADFVVNARTRGLPPEVRRAAARLFANWMGCALGAADDDTVRAVLQFAARVGGPGPASIVGRGTTLDPVNAALANGVAANALDYDDMHVPTLIHPSVPVVAAALALAEDRRTGGETLLRAIVVGVEVECRLGLALFPAHYDAGWHSTATLGTLGAAAAACVVLQLDAGQTTHALGIAATQASGLRAMLPNACKSYNTGHAAASGVRAALLAQSGLTSAPAVLEEKFGLFHAFGAPRDLAALTAGLGEHSLVGEVSLKPYPCGVVIHPLIDACLALARATDLDPARLRSLDAHVHPRALELAGRPHPEDAITGRFSLHHAAALALARRSAGLADFEGADVHDPLLASLRSRMTIAGDTSLTPGQARATLTLDDGAKHTNTVAHPSGSPQRPLTDAQLEAKFMELAARTVARPAAVALYAACLALGDVADVANLRGHWLA